MDTAITNDSYEEIPFGDIKATRNVTPQSIVDRNKQRAELGYVPIKVPDITNIHTYLRKDSVSRSPLSSIIASIKNKPIDAQFDLLEVVISMYTIRPTECISHESCEELLLIKAVFHELIVRFNRVNNISKYNAIFNDGQFDKLQASIDVNITPVEMSDKDKQSFLLDYQKRMHEEEIRKRLNSKPAKYVVGDIVGAQDKEGRWWMSRVLAVFNYMQQHMYYIEFLGWGETFNEFIVSPLRIQWYNPKKHRYYRAAKISVQDGDDADDGIDNPTARELANNPTARLEDSPANNPTAKELANNPTARESSCVPSYPRELESNVVECGSIGGMWV